MEVKEKQANIELLRIIAMLMIIMHHFCFHGVFSYWNENSNIVQFVNDVIVSFASMGGKVGVDIFVIITGYFMITSKFKLFHFLRTYLKMFIYSILCLSAAFIWGTHSVPSNVLKQSLFPFISNSYWFISNYLVLYLLVPYINTFIKTAEKSMLNSLLIITTLLWVILPTFVSVHYEFSILLFFIYLYFVGAAIRTGEYGAFFTNRKAINILALASVIFWILFAVIKCAHHDTVNFWKMCHPAQINSLFTISIALFLFHLFKNLDIGHNKIINSIAASVFGVYLFHDNIIVRPFLWRKLLHVVTYMNTPYLLPYMIVCTLGVFIFCVILDKVLFFILNKPVKIVCTKLENAIKNLTAKVSEAINFSC